MGLWSNTDDCHFLLTIKPTENKLTDPTTFENEFRQQTTPHP